MINNASFNATTSLVQGLFRKLIEEEFGPNSDTYYRDADIAYNGEEIELVLTKHYPNKQETKRVKLEVFDDITGGAIREIKTYFRQ